MNSGSLSVNCQPDCLGRGLEGLHWEVEAQLEVDLDTQEGLCPASLWESLYVCCQELEHLSESTLGNDRLTLGTNKEEISSQCVYRAPVEPSTHRSRPFTSKEPPFSVMLSTI